MLINRTGYRKDQWLRIDEGALTLTRYFSHKSWKETMYKCLGKHKGKKFYEPKRYLLEKMLYLHETANSGEIIGDIHITFYSF